MMSTCQVGQMKVMSLSVEKSRRNVINEKHWSIKRKVKPSEPVSRKYTVSELNCDDNSDVI